MINENDLVLIGKLKGGDDESLEEVYLSNRDYCVAYLRNFTGRYSEDFLDIYTDSIIVLFENVKKGSFYLSCSIKTYLCSVCKNIVRQRERKGSKIEETLLNEYEIDQDITHTLEEYDVLRDDNLKKIEKAMAILHRSGGPCYELLNRYYYMEQTFDQIAMEMNYKNGDAVKNQKSRCQKRIKEILLRNPNL